MSSNNNNNSEEVVEVAGGDDEFVSPHQQPGSVVKGSVINGGGGGGTSSSSRGSGGIVAGAVISPPNGEGMGGGASGASTAFDPVAALIDNIKNKTLSKKENINEKKNEKADEEPKKDDGNQQKGDVDSDEDRGSATIVRKRKIMPSALKKAGSRSHSVSSVDDEKPPSTPPPRVQFAPTPPESDDEAKKEEKKKSSEEVKPTKTVVQEKEKEKETDMSSAASPPAPSSSPSAGLKRRPTSRSLKKKPSSSSTTSSPITKPSKAKDSHEKEYEKEGKSEKSSAAASSSEPKKKKQGEEGILPPQDVVTTMKLQTLTAINCGKEALVDVVKQILSDVQPTVATSTAIANGNSPANVTFDKTLSTMSNSNENSNSNGHMSPEDQDRLVDLLVADLLSSAGAASSSVKNGPSAPQTTNNSRNETNNTTTTTTTNISRHQQLKDCFLSPSVPEIEQTLVDNYYTDEAKRRGIIADTADCRVVEVEKKTTVILKKKKKKKKGEKKSNKMKDTSDGEESSGNSDSSTLSAAGEDEERSRENSNTTNEANENEKESNNTDNIDTSVTSVTPLHVLKKISKRKRSGRDDNSDNNAQPHQDSRRKRQRKQQHTNVLDTLTHIHDDDESSSSDLDNTNTNNKEDHHQHQHHQSDIIPKGNNNGTVITLKARLMLRQRALQAIKHPYDEYFCNCLPALGNNFNIEMVGKHWRDFSALENELVVAKTIVEKEEEKMKMLRVNQRKQSMQQQEEKDDDSGRKESGNDEDVFRQILFGDDQNANNNSNAGILTTNINNKDQVMSDATIQEALLMAQDIEEEYEDKLDEIQRSIDNVLKENCLLAHSMGILAPNKKIMEGIEREQRGEVEEIGGESDDDDFVRRRRNSSSASSPSSSSSSGRSDSSGGRKKKSKKKGKGKKYIGFKNIPKKKKNKRDTSSSSSSSSSSDGHHHHHRHHHKHDTDVPPLDEVKEVLETAQNIEFLDGLMSLYGCGDDDNFNSAKNDEENHHYPVSRYHDPYADSSSEDEDGNKKHDVPFYPELNAKELTDDLLYERKLQRKMKKTSSGECILGASSSSFSRTTSFSDLSDYDGKSRRKNKKKCEHRKGVKIKRGNVVTFLDHLHEQEEHQKQLAAGEIAALNNRKKKRIDPHATRQLSKRREGDGLMKMRAMLSGASAGAMMALHQNLGSSSSHNNEKSGHHMLSPFQHHHDDTEYLCSKRTATIGIQTIPEELVPLDAPSCPITATDKTAIVRYVSGSDGVPASKKNKKSSSSSNHNDDDNQLLIPPSATVIHHSHGVSRRATASATTRYLEHYSSTDAVSSNSMTLSGQLEGGGTENRGGGGGGVFLSNIPTEVHANPFEPIEATAISNPSSIILNGMVQNNAEGEEEGRGTGKGGRGRSGSPSSNRGRSASPPPQVTRILSLSPARVDTVDPKRGALISPSALEMSAVSAMMLAAAGNKTKSGESANSNNFAVDLTGAGTINNGGGEGMMSMSLLKRLSKSSYSNGFVKKPFTLTTTLLPSLPRSHCHQPYHHDEQFEKAITNSNTFRKILQWSVAHPVAHEALQQCEPPVLRDLILQHCGERPEDVRKDPVRMVTPITHILDNTLTMGLLVVQDHHISVFRDNNNIDPAKRHLLIPKGAIRRVQLGTNITANTMVPPIPFGHIPSPSLNFFLVSNVPQSEMAQQYYRTVLIAAVLRSETPSRNNPNQMVVKYSESTLTVIFDSETDATRFISLMELDLNGARGDPFSPFYVPYVGAKKSCPSHRWMKSMKSTYKKIEKIKEERERRKKLAAQGGAEDQEDDDAAASAKKDDGGGSESDSPSGGKKKAAKKSSHKKDKSPTKSKKKSAKDGKEESEKDKKALIPFSNCPKTEQALHDIILNDLTKNRKRALQQLLPPLPRNFDNFGWNPLWHHGEKDPYAPELSWLNNPTSQLQYAKVASMANTFPTHNDLLLNTVEFSFCMLNHLHPRYYAEIKLRLLMDPSLRWFSALDLAVLCPPGNGRQLNFHMCRLLLDFLLLGCDGASSCLNGDVGVLEAGGPDFVEAQAGNVGPGGKKAKMRPLIEAVEVIETLPPQ